MLSYSYASACAQQLIDAVARQDTRQMLRCLCEANGGHSDWLNLPYNERDPRSGLHIAATLGRLEYLQLLLWAGADVSVVDHEGRNALFYALSSGQHECAELLSRRGCPDQGFVLPPPPQHPAPAILSATAAAVPPAAGGTPAAVSGTTRQQRREREREREEVSRPVPDRPAFVGNSPQMQQQQTNSANINLAIMSPVSNRLSPKNPVSVPLSSTGISSSADRSSPFAPQRTLQSSQNQNADSVPPPPMHRGLHAYADQQQQQMASSSASAVAQGAAGGVAANIAQQSASSSSSSSPPHSARSLPPIQEQQPVRLRNNPVDTQGFGIPGSYKVQQVGPMPKETAFDPDVRPAFEIKPAKPRSKPRDRPDGATDDAGSGVAPPAAAVAPNRTGTGQLQSNFNPSATAAVAADAIVIGTAAPPVSTTMALEQLSQAGDPQLHPSQPQGRQTQASTPGSGSADGAQTGGVAMLSAAFNNISLYTASASATLPRRGALANGTGRVANIANIQEQLFRQNSNMTQQQAQVSLYSSL